MSDFKNWKNKERGQNIAEKFGLKFDINALSERGDVGFGEGEPADDEWSDKQEIELSEEEDQEEIEEGGLARRKKDPRDRRGHEKDRLREEEDETEAASADADADALEELIRKHVRTALEELKNES
tara:strand:+ start:24 stop:401 length:378 start_codon:yes stop_codon:yes gene_type:complete